MTFFEKIKFINNKVLIIVKMICSKQIIFLFFFLKKSIVIVFNFLFFKKVVYNYFLIFFTYFKYALSISSFTSSNLFNKVLTNSLLILLSFLSNKSTPSWVIPFLVATLLIISSLDKD